MPLVKMPDGTEVDMPETLTPEQMQRFRAVIAAQHANVGTKDIPDSQPQPKPKEEPSTLAGIPGAILTGLSAIPAQIAGNLAGAATRIGGGSMEDAAKKVDEVASKMMYTPSPAGQAALEKVSKIVDDSKIAGLNPATAMTASRALPPGSIQSAARNAIRAIADSPEADAAQTAAGAVKAAPGAAMKAAVIPEVRALAQKASDIGMDIRPDMLTDNKFMRMMGEALEKVPLSGSKAEQRQVAFNRAIMGQIGVDTRGTPVKRLTPDVFDAAMNKSGGVIGDISKKTPIQLAADEAGGLDQSLSAFVDNAKKFELTDHARIAENYVKEIRAKAENGVLPGEAFRRINSKLGAQMRSTKDGDLKRVLSELQDTMQDALERHVSPDDFAALREARKQYAIGKTIEPLVAKAKIGDLSPVGLMGAVTSDNFKKGMMARGHAGTLGDLARIGQAFLKEPESSGTAERSVALGLLGGGAAIEPHTAAGVYAMANLYNRAGPAIAKKMIGKKAVTLADIEKMADAK